MALQDAGEELIAEYSDINIAIVTEYDLALKEGKSIIETEGDAHAGEIETSRILHSHPWLVKGKGEREFPDFPIGILVREKRKYWPNGVWGDPSKASAEKGSFLEDLVVKKIVEIVQKMDLTS
jgi:creatinine amidohydrolase